MRVTQFEWDDGNVEHIARHGVEPDEAEEVFGGVFIVRRAHGQRYVALGQSLSGRYLAVIFCRQEHGLTRVVTARDMNRTEQRLFWRSA